MWLYLVFKALIYHIAFWNWLAFYVLYFYCLFILKWSIRLFFVFQRCVHLFVVLPSDMMLNWMYLTMPNFCFTSLFYISSRNINWILFERVEWQQFNLPFSSRENFSLYLRRRKNTTAPKRLCDGKTFHSFVILMLK